MAGLAFAPEIAKVAPHQRSAAAPSPAIPGWSDYTDSALTDYLVGLGLEDVKSAQADVTDSKGTTRHFRPVRIFIIEEQQILKQTYQTLFSSYGGAEVLGSCGDMSPASLETVTMLAPDVVLLGVKAVSADTVGKLVAIRKANHETGIVLLSSIYDAQGIKALRQFPQGSLAGCAYLLKHTVDTKEQLTQAIHSVAEGRVIVDPAIMGELIKTEQFQTSALRELSPKALEVLSWMAKGYRNETIAGVMARDVKTIERHINNIYGTIFCDDDETGDRRVSAALMYLRATGSLS